MTPTRKGDTREALLTAAAELISATPGQDVPLRAICDRVGVKLPTLYHFFGNKQGLLDAVIDYGFDRYLSVKRDHEPSGDPVADIRDGWDAHVEFGLANPGFYALMYGQVCPGVRPQAQQQPHEILLGLTRTAAEQDRLTVSPQRAADHILAANVGVTLFLITASEPDLALSAAVREATLAAISGTSAAEDVPATDGAATAHTAQQLLTLLGTSGSPLGTPETVLLRKWLTTLARET